MTLGDHSDEKRLEEEVGERLDEYSMSEDQLEEQVYQRFRTMSEEELDAEMEELEVRYGRVDPAYEAAFKRVLKERGKSY